MLGLKLGLAKAKKKAAFVAVRDFQNSDAVPVPGVTYVWTGDALWVAANIWKG